MDNKDQWLWVPMLGLMAGGAIPLFFADFAEESWQDRIWGGMLTVTLTFTYALFKRVGNKYPALNDWALNTIFGATFLMFTGTFVASSLSVAFAILPIPHWLHIVVGLFLALFAMVLLFGDSGNTASISYKWKNNELGLYFTPNENDKVWGEVTPQAAESIQEGFLWICRKAELEKYTNTNDLPSKVINIICNIANAVGEKNNLNPSFIILASHQYIDADPMIRQLHKNRWVASIVDRTTSAPPPESYLEYIKSTYFSDDE